MCVKVYNYISLNINYCKFQLIFSKCILIFLFDVNQVNRVEIMDIIVILKELNIVLLKSEEFFLMLLYFFNKYKVLCM